MTKKRFPEYYLGIDAGTDSTGLAVTDTNYELLKLNGKSMWGVRLFDSGKTASERRLYRTSTRRTQRKAQRIALLEEIFASEIAQVDFGFYQRMKDSFFVAEDKSERQPYSLFNDKSYTDKEYHNEFPTIYHLRKALLEDDRKFDIRLVYLAVHHIIKNRGHFLYEGMDIKSISSFANVFNDFAVYINDEFDCVLTAESSEKIENILKSSKMGIKTKENSLIEIFGADNKQIKAICGLLAGGRKSLSSIFNDKELDFAEKNKICFSDSDYDDNLDLYRDILQDRMYVIEKAKAVFDWGLLAEMLAGHHYLSYAKVDIYNKHKKDLALLKKIVKKHLPNAYKELFNDNGQSANYCAYAGKSSKKNVCIKKKCSQEDFCKYTEKILASISAENDNDEELVYLRWEAAGRTLLPKQASKNNSVIPYQLNLHELQLILDKASKHYAFLNSMDENGYVIKDKIISLLTFRIPYYVGPLNDYHKGEKNSNCWVVKRSDEKIRPWNFDKIVDKEQSAENFITRMTNKCTYLIGEDVLPKDSLLYSEFTVLNEINNLRINGEPVNIELKKRIMDELYRQSRKVTRNKLESYLKKEGITTENDTISGVDTELKANMSSFNDLKKRLGGKVFDTDMCENLIKWIVLFGDDKNLLRSRIEREYKNVLSDAEIKAVIGLKFSGWGRLSRKLLEDIYHVVDTHTGECINIITAMRETNENFMQLLGAKYTFADKIAAENVRDMPREAEFSYDMVDDLYVSPSIKRSIWQSLSMVREIYEITRRQPKKIFVEMARGEEEKKRTESRKSKLLDLYKSIKDENRDWLTELGAKEDSELRSEKLYLYYTQMGKCMYSGQSIELSQLVGGTQIYDIDHIFPQSKIKDDSIDNKVLVLKTYNEEKSDKYPINPQWREKMTPFWRMLKTKGFISEKKFDRLTRAIGFTNEELTDFISRQLVETRQSTKALAQILGQIFNESEIVYVKAGNVSKFRQDYGFTKVREINDYHHAKDAYLNIVVGNVYNTKFTHSPANYIKHNGLNYNLNKMYDFDVESGGVPAWKCGDSGTITTVKRTMAKNNVLFTRYAYVNGGAISDRQLVKKGEGLLPIKGSDIRLANTERYGGYNSVKGAYFFLAEHTLKNKRVKTIEFVPVYLKDIIDQDKDALFNYCINELKLIEPVIKIDKIKINTLFEIEGFPAHLSGRTGSRITFKGAYQLILNKENTDYIKKVSKFAAKNQNSANELIVNSYDKISKEENMKMYETLLDKLKTTAYKVMLAAQINTLEGKRDVFADLTEARQCKVLMQILKLFECNILTADLSLLGGGAHVGNILLSKNITEKEIKIIHQSPTGLFEYAVELLTL